MAKAKANIDAAVTHLEEAAEKTLKGLYPDGGSQSDADRLTQASAALCGIHALLAQALDELRPGTGVTKRMWEEFETLNAAHSGRKPRFEDR